ncbi:MAG: hypothetical protein IIX85_07495 [Clostridia bacterium]|nr:hypothetical protein [Clostridia bacterium]MBQ2272953.1 hypothetical protein [Clostridia bacterium]MBQ5821277.1 hypothetical protein [Clostridia bacterium]
MKIGIVNKLIQYFPELKGDIESHLEIFHGIYLHLIFGDVFNPFLLNLLDNPQINRLELIKASELIEYMSNLDNSVQEVVVTTVLERLLSEPKKFTLFSEIAGEQTRQFITDLK